jgi:fibronectin-binding autotransporter adhesin
MKTPTNKNKLFLKLRALLILGVTFGAAQLAQAATEYWIGVDNVSATTNWSDTANWNPTGTPGSADTALFGVDGTVSDALTVNSALTANTTVTGLSYTNNTSGAWHVTQIPAGVTLNVTGPMIVGGSTNNGLVTDAAFVDAGTLSLAGNLTVGNNGGTSAATGTTLDLSGLTNFVYNNSGGTIGISLGNRSAANLKLASGSNYITVGTLNANSSSTSSGASGTITLGTGTNIINVGTINAAIARNNNTFQFPSGSTTGGLRLRGVGGTDNDRANLTMANRNQNTSGGTDTGNMNFNGHPVDIKFGTVTMGQAQATGPTGVQTGSATISFDTGIIDATTINMAIVGANAFNNAIGIINVGASATLVVSNLSMANQGPLGTNTGVLNINGGTVIVSNSIFKTSAAGIASIYMTGGSLNVSNAIGSASAVLSTNSFSDATLTLPVTLTPAIYVTNLIAAGAANTINVTTVPAFFSYPAQFPIISYQAALGDNSTFVAGTLPGIFKGYVSNNVAGLSIDIVITNGPALAPLKSIRWNGSPTGDWTTNTSVLNWLTNSTAVNYNQGDTVTFDDTLTGTPNVNLTQTLLPSSVIVNNSSANYVLSGIGKISGDAGLTKTGSGTLILDNSGTNDFVGAVTISAGTLQVGNNDTNGNLPAVGSWDDEGTLAFSRADNVVISQIISGAGSLVQRGDGKLTLNVAEPYTGNTIVTKGTLALGSAGSIASTAGIFPQGGAFDVSTADPSVLLNVVGANGGTLVLGTNSVNIGTLNLTNSTITLSADFAKPQSLNVTTLTAAGSTNIINLTGVLNAGGQSIPSVITLIRYGSATFVGGFKFGETNFPNAYVTNNAANNSIDLVLTATPYVVTWNGGSSTDNNWTDSNNWSGLPIYPGDALFFDGTARLNPVNDTAAGTAYSNITFNAAAGAFTLTGNPITFSGSVANNSANPQTVDLPLNFVSNMSLDGTAAPLIIGGGVTNTHVGLGSTTLTLTGTGILTNLLGSSAANGGTNLLVENASGGTWTLLDNASSATVTAPWAFSINDGTFNFGSASSAPKVISTSPQGVPQDDQVGGAGGAAVLNFTNGLFTTSSRLNTGGNSSSGTINQYGGTINIASQFQGANGSASASSAVNLYGGTMNVGVSVASTNSSTFTTNFGPFYVASRGNGSLTITNSALLNCGTLDVSRNAAGATGGSVGVVNLNGGAIRATRVGTATANGVTGIPASATFNFNGGTLIAGASSSTFFQGRTTDPITPIIAIVSAGGAIIDSDTNTISFLEPLLTDPTLGGAVDGGLKKFGTGTLNLSGTNTYIGKTLVGAGTLNINGQSISAVIVSNSATLGGNGVISNTVTVNTGGTLSPGSSSIGTLTVATNAIALNGTTRMEVDKIQSTSDLLALVNDTPTTITYGGTLDVPVVAGSLAPGDTFKLFSANNYIGSFAAITPANVTWNTSNLNVDGTLTVVSIAPTGPTTNATITSVTLSGTNLLVHGTNNNVPNTAGHYVVLTSTNLSTPLSNWTPMATNTYTSGTFDFSIPVVPGTAQKYIDVQAVP